jgi:chemotaxis methyl-accepting protein methylase
MAAAEGDEAAFRALLEQVARDRGFACGNYKDGCLRRRVSVRMRARGISDFAAYATLLRQDDAEYERLMDTLTINVTRLYRDADVWDSFATEILPELWNRTESGLNVWSAGCSSGEELYTLAAIIDHHASASGSERRLKSTRIVGTDIDAASLRAARVGSYADAAFKEMPVALRNRYFIADSALAGSTAPAGTGTRTAAAELRALVRVERRDLILEDPPGQGFDLITCRNLLIYLDRTAQEAIFRRFHAALAPHGILMLGKVETMLGPARQLFASRNQRSRIFRKAP